MTQILQRKLKIMLVDDNDIYALISIKMIEAYGIATDTDVCVFTDGWSGIEYLRAIEAENPSFLPDLILLNINMPICDGFCFLDEFATLNDAYKSRRPVAMLTSSFNPRDIKKSMSYSYVRLYLCKPLTVEALRKLGEGFYSEWRSDEESSTNSAP